MYCELILENISLNIKLGWLEEERAFSQQVLVQIKIRFSDIPTVCMTDNLRDGLCYSALSSDLQVFCDTRSFKLIETLGYQLYQFLKKKITELISEPIKVFVCVTKHPLFVNLERSCFVISD